MSRREATKIVSRGRLLSSVIDQTRQAWAAGEVTSEKATIISRALDKLPEDLDAGQQHHAQTHLLDLADRFGADDLRRLANHVLEVIDPAGCEARLGKQVALEEQNAYAHSELTMQEIGEGMVRGRFTLPTLQAHMLKTVLEGIASPRRHDARIYEIDCDGDQCDAANGRLTHSQRLGRAWCELIEHLPSDAMPDHGGLAATVTITIDHQVLKEAIDGQHCRPETISQQARPAASPAMQIWCPWSSTANRQSSTPAPAKDSTTIDPHQHPMRRARFQQVLAA